MSNRQHKRKASKAPAARLPRWKKLVFAVLTITLFFLCLEGVLGLLGVEAVSQREDPYVGFTSSIPHFVTHEAPGGRTTVKTASNRLDHFNPQSFPAEKPPNNCRIFCVGGSTTYGRPFFDRTSFPGWLRALLPEVDPSRNYEVINAGGLSYASYRVTLVMEELAAYEPDVFIVYAGHNEFLERRTYEGILETPSLLRNAAALALQTRTASILRTALGGAATDTAAASDKPNMLSADVDAIPVNSVGPEAYSRNDEWKRQVVAHFKISLERMVDIAEAAGAEIVLVTPASNLLHLAPFKSEHKDGLSSDQMRQSEHFYQAG